MIKKINELKNHKGFIKYFRNSSWLLLEKLLRLVLGFFIGIWVARYLGPSDFGIFSYVQSYIALFAIIASLGLDSFIVRELLNNVSKRDALLGTAFSLKIVSSIFSISMLSFITYLTSSDTHTNWLIFIVSFSLIFQSFNVIDGYFQSEVLSKYVVFSNTIMLIISSIVKIILIFNEAELVYFIWVMLFDSILLASGLVYFYLKQKLSFANWKFDRKIAVKLLKDCWPFILIGISVVVYERIDQIMIKEFIDSTNLGFYSAAIKIYAVIVTFSPLVSVAFQPALINAHKVSADLFKRRCVYLYTFTIWGLLFVCFFIYNYAYEIIYYTFSEKYIEANEALKIYIFCSIFAFIGGINSIRFIIFNRQKLMSYYLIMGMICNVVLNYILIPKYGIVGACVASLISFALSDTIFNILSKKSRENLYLQIIALFYPLVIAYNLVLKSLKVK